MKKTNISGDYRQYMDKNYVGEWDLPEKDDLIATIDHAEVNDVVSERGTAEKLTVRFKGDLKPLIVNATNGAAIKEATGFSDVEKWKGAQISLYREKVSAFGKTTMAVRVRPYPPKQEEYFCKDCGVKIEDNGKYSARAIAEQSQSKFGRALCMDCAHKVKEAQEAAEKEGDVLSDENNEDQD